MVGEEGDDGGSGFDVTSGACARWAARPGKVRQVVGRLGGWDIPPSATVGFSGRQSKGGAGEA